MSRRIATRTPSRSSDVVEYILTQHLYSQAADWMNRRIEAYLERR